MTELPARPISPHERQTAVDTLCAHFAADHIATDEFERRLDLAYAAQAKNELVALFNDLPELQQESTSVATPAPVAAPSVEVDTTRQAAEREFMLAVMGGTERKGRWTPPRHMTVLAMMGGAGLDFRDAVFAHNEINVTIFSIMGGAEILIPPGVRVESNGIAIMGGFGAAQQTEATDPNAPVIRINGLVLMGGVDIQERRPHESEREARKRLKAEKKAAKQAALPPG
jgi:hypothetical protein